MNCLDVEREVEKLMLAMMTRNPAIGKDLMANLRMYFTHQELAGLLLVSLERMLWFDTDLVFWAIEHLIPPDLMREIRDMTSMAVYSQLIRKGFIPGEDLSVDANGKLLLKQTTRLAMRY